MIKRFYTKTGFLYFSSCPDKKELEQLKELGVDCIWNMAKELKYISDIERLYIKEVICADIYDADTPENELEFISQLKYISDLLLDGKKVFVHCMAGHGRTGMALVLLSTIVNNGPFEKMLKYSQTWCGGPKRYNQVDYVKEVLGLKF